MSRSVDVVVIGAGPYGLATAAELRRAGADVHVLGSLMSFWIEHMPQGMFLRSPWDASHIGSPGSDLNLSVFERSRGARLSRPLPVADFIDYARWFQRQAGFDVDPRMVERVDARDGSFRVTLEDREPIDCRRVVVAAGIGPFAVRPAAFDGLPRELASHSNEHSDLARFAGQQVAVIGSGQSGTESAALLRERGADVELIMRAPRLSWIGRAPRRGLIGRMLFDRTDVGPMLFSHLIARPTLLERFPLSVHDAAVRRALAPGAALWLRERLKAVKITPGRRVVTATRSSGQAHLRLDDGSTRVVDHVLLATGYRTNVRLYRFLPPQLLARVRCVDDHPVLDRGFQSSVPGLHFVGAPAMRSFGPLLRFVSGTEFAARGLVRNVTLDRRGETASDRPAEARRATQRAQ
jgi:cation diffusion facilitator CzcD-associated flavoprotein CzcO